MVKTHRKSRYTKQKSSSLPNFADRNKAVKREVREKKDLKILDRKDFTGGADLVLSGFVALGLAGVASNV